MEKKTDLRIQKTYLALQNAFVSLLEEKRFEEVTVNELCDRAMIRRATFYKHFADKYEYFAFYIREMVAAFRAQLPQDVVDGNIADYITQMSQARLEYANQHEKMVRNIGNSSMFPVLISIFLDQVTDEITIVLRRACQNSRKAKGIAAFYAGGLVNTFLRCVRRDAEIDEAVFLEIAAEYAAKIPQQLADIQKT